MNEQDRTGPLSPLPPGLDAVCDTFEAAWKQAGERGPAPAVEAFLGASTGGERAALLHELVALDIVYRRRRGVAPTVEEYAGRFAELGKGWLRREIDRASSTPTPVLPPAGTPGDGEEAGLRLRCPHCRNPLQLADERSDEVLCPGCGASFRVRDARQTNTVSASKPLGKFQLLERVGQGAFGAVWKARDTELDRVVALKIPHAGSLTEGDELERFHREARAAAQLRHEGIVPVHEVVTLEGLPTIVCDFVQGVTLKDFLEVRRPTFPEAAELVAGIAEALDYAHRKGLVHRDIKPANIMLEKEVGAAGLGRPLLMDFGLALRDGAEVTLTLDGHVIGTPAYMSPEQASGKSHFVDRRSDVYSLGVVLYELLCGELPFRGSKMMILHQVLHDEPQAPRRLNNKIPRDLETMCLKCLEKAPDRRYATAGDLADDLRRFLKGEPIAARPVGRAERLWRWGRREPVVAGLLATVMVTLTLGAAAATYFGLSAREQANLAEQREGQAIEKEKETRAALERVEETLAVGLLRPLGHGVYGSFDRDFSHLNEYEMSALEDLARVRRESDRTRLLFIGMALEKPETAEQLERQVEEAVTATVGLRRDLRERVIQIAASRLQDENSNAKVRVASACILAAARSENAELARRCLTISIDQVPATTDSRALQRLMTANLQHIGQLPTKDAEELARQIVSQAPKSTGPGQLLTLSHAFAAMAAKLPPEQAATETRKLARLVIAKFTEKDKFAEADELRGSELRGFDQVFAALAPRLSAEQAGELAQQILSLTAESGNANLWDRLGQAFSTLVPRLSAEQAGEMARQVLGLAAKSTDVDQLVTLSKAYVALTTKLHPEQAAKEARRVAGLAIALVAKSPALESGKLLRIVEACAALPPKLSAEEVRELARQVLALASKSHDIFELHLLCEAYATLAPGLPAEQAAKESGELARLVIAQTAFNTLPLLGLYVAKSFVVLVPWLSAKEAKELARQVLALAGKYTDVSHLLILGRAYAALAAKLPSEQAVKGAEGLARQIISRAAKSTEADDLLWLGMAYDALAPKLPHEQAAKEAGGLVQQVLALAAKSADADKLDSFITAFVILAPRLPANQAPKDAALLARHIAALAAKSKDVDESFKLSKAFAALVPWLPAEQAGHFAIVVCSRLSWVSRAYTPYDEASTTFAALLPLLPDQPLLNVLKQPGVGPHGRAAVVAEFGKRLQRTFRHQWDLAEYLERARPDLDLTSPPARGEQP